MEIQSCIRPKGSKIRFTLFHRPINLLKNSLSESKHYKKKNAFQSVIPTSMCFSLDKNFQKKGGKKGIPHAASINLVMTLQLK